jgi:hypothetical protein
MSWTRCSKLAALAVLIVSLAAAPTAVALSSSAEGVPGESQVGTEVSATFVVADPFTEAPDEWTLRGETELGNVSWTVTVIDQGDQISQETYGNQSFNHSLTNSEGGDEVRVELVGAVPAIENYTYDPRETYRLAILSRVQGSNVQEIDAWTPHHYTEKSKEAREAIDAASAAIDEAGGNQEAEEQLQRAIRAYESANSEADFENAIDLANDAEQKAEQAQQSRQTMQLALYAVGGLVVLLLIGGGIYDSRSQQDTYDKLG